jgi:glycosyltransferase involved in cell wall biosynthesis
MGHPVATIVITTRDRPDFLLRAMGSAVNQTLRDIEIVVVDDGSKNPVQLVGVDDRIRVIRHEKALGLCAARNSGMAVARSDWITFLDDDDELLPRMIEASLTAVRESLLPPPVAVWSGVEVIDPTGKVIAVHLPPNLPRGDNYMVRVRPPRHKVSLVAPIEILTAVGGWDDKMLASEHDDLLLRLNPACSIQAVRSVMYRWTHHGGPRLTKHYALFADGIARTLSKHHATISRNPRAHARLLAEMAKHYSKGGKWLPAVRAAVRAVSLDPKSRNRQRDLLTCLVGTPLRPFWRRIRRALG